LILFGLLIRVGLVFVPDPNSYDRDSFRLMLEGLKHDPLAVYSLQRWPYPPLYFPWIALSGRLARTLPLSFDLLVRTPAMAADVLIALLLVWYLQRHGATGRHQLAAAALVMLGPSFFLISGFHGQIDSIIGLSSMVAVIVWEASPRRRASTAGLVLGIGAAVKTVPLVGAIALLPSARSKKEAVEVVALSVAVPLFALLPFLLADPSHTVAILRYGGFPASGGLTLVAQPRLAEGFLLRHPYGAPGTPYWEYASSLTTALWHEGAVLVAGGLLVTLLIAWRRRVPPRLVAVAVWLTVFSLSPTFFFQYILWGMPIFLLNGNLKAVAVLQAALLIPSLLFELGPWDQEWLAYVYIVIMIGVWLALSITYCRSLVGLWRWKPAEPSPA
jgi:hypothetical protein